MSRVSPDVKPQCTKITLKIIDFGNFLQKYIKNICL